MLVFIHDGFSIFSLVTSQITKSGKSKVLIIQPQASGKVQYWSGVCSFDSGTEHPPSFIQKLQKIQIGQMASKLFCNPFHNMLGFLISKFGFAGNFCSQPRNAMILADGSVILHCSAIVAAVQCWAKQCPRKKNGKSEMRRMQDDHSYLALYRDTAVVYAPRRSPIPGEKVRREAWE